MMKNLIQKISFLAVLVLFSGVLSAQNGITRVSGKVVFEGKRALAGTLVKIKKTNISAICNAAGEYSMQVPAGLFTLLFNYQNIRNFEYELDIQPFNSYVLNVDFAPYYTDDYIVRMQESGSGEEIKASTAELEIFSQVQGELLFDGMGLPAGEISLKSSTKKVSSNAEGKFEIALKKGKNILIFSFNGFQSFEQVLDIQLDKSYYLKVQFAPPYRKDYIEKLKKEGRASEIKQASCQIIIK